jgi:hypothetical protein
MADDPKDVALALLLGWWRIEHPTLQWMRSATNAEYIDSDMHHRNYNKLGTKYPGYNIFAEDAARAIKHDTK